MKLCDRDNCTGCSACGAICPKHVISMCPDSEGFLFPKEINPKSCTHCGLCVKACPIISSKESRRPLAVYATQAKDRDLRLRSSSGGIFSLIARGIFARGGIVVGAGWDKKDWKVIHCVAEDETSLANLRGAKYVQSEMGDVFQSIGHELENGRIVCFTGTPCQVAGLRSWLNCKQLLSSHEGEIYFIEVACAAVASPLAWGKYVEECQSKRREIDSVSFRNKRKSGWKNYAFSLSFKDGLTIIENFHINPYLRGFNHSLYNRRSCHNCQFRNLKSGADLTIGDYWNVVRKFPEMDDDCGTSLVLVNTLRGMELYKSVSALVEERVSEFEDAIRVNPTLIQSPIPHKLRPKFFASMAKGERFSATVKRLLRQPLRAKCLIILRKIARRIWGK